MKHSSEDAYSDLCERALVKKLRAKLWPLEVQLPTGWLWYRQLVDEESKNSIGATSSEYPKITKPPYLKHHNDEIFHVNPLTGKLEGSTCPENPRMNKLQAQVVAVRQGANVTIRKFRKAKTLRALVDSGLTRDDYFHVLSRISMMFEDSKAEDYWVSTGRFAQ